MIRILIIGNSQVGAFRLGWNSISADHPDIEMRFFAQPGRPFYDFSYDPVASTFGAHDPSAFDDDVVRHLSKRAGGLTVQVNECDHVFLVGHKQGHPQLFDLLDAFEIDDLRSNPGKPLMSLSTFRALMGDVVRSDAVAWPLEDASVPVTICPPARISEAVGRSQSPRPIHALVRSLLKAPDGLREALDVLDGIVGNTLAERGLGFLPQPESTLAATGLTATQFRRQDTDVGSSKNADDFNHMNDDYGVVFLRDLVDYLRNDGRSLPK